ncbi:MAG: hypothetical protein IJQ16_04345 [Selenomonadaceae bacterium]|nr:hypothetical protein [Selenomonadaceae bacterium]
MENFFTILLIGVIIIFIGGTFRAFMMSRKSVALIQRYENDKKNPQLIQDIFSELEKDFFLRRIVKRHNATVSDIAKLHAKLLKWGDFRKYNRYIPITSFFNTNTLEYLLTHKDADAKSLTEKMMNHFHF